MSRYGYTQLRSGHFDRHSPLSVIVSRGAAGLERGEAFADVDRGPQLPIDAVDPDVDPPDLREQLTFQRDRLGPKRIDLGREPDIQVVNLATQSADLRREPGVHPVDLLIQRGDLRLEPGVQAA